MTTHHPSWTDARLAQASVINDQQAAASARATPDQVQTPSVDAVAAGSLPASSAIALAEVWERRAGKCAHENPVRAFAIRQCSTDLRRLAGLPIPRQPEENTPVSQPVETLSRKE